MVGLLDVRKVHSRYRRTANDGEDEKRHQERDQNHAAVEDQPEAAPAFAVGVEENWFRTGHCAGRIYRSCAQPSGQQAGTAVRSLLVFLLLLNPVREETTRKMQCHLRPVSAAQLAAAIGYRMLYSPRARTG